MNEYSVAGLLAGYRQGGLSPVTVVEQALALRARAHRALNCTAYALDETALAAAAESERRWRGGTPRPLEGVPFSIKDLFDLAGAPTRAGSRLTAGHRAGATARVLQRLAGAGAVLVAKDATTEWAIGGARNPEFGIVRNPWSADRWAGGSSSGSAAMVAAGVVPFAIGTDTGGSIRVPAAFCGIVGLKPTNGLVSTAGLAPLSPTLDTVGVLARHAGDASRVLAVAAGHDPEVPHSLHAGYAHAAAPGPRLDGVRVGVLGGVFMEDLDRSVEQACSAAAGVLRDLGATVSGAELPLAAHAQEIGYQLLYTEAWALHRDRRERLADYDPAARARIAQGAASSASDYLAMLGYRHALQCGFGRAFEDFDVLLTPGCPGTAPGLADLAVDINGRRVPLLAAQSRTTIMCNLAGLPALMMPAGFAADGMPVAAQLVCPPLREALALRVAAAFQQATDHHARTPAAFARPG